MPAGSRVLLYTDGVTEAMSPSREGYGIARLTAHLQATAQQSAGRCADTLLTAVAEWGGGKLDDDITVLVIDHRTDHH